MRDFFTDYQMAVDSIGVIGEILGLNSSQYMTKSPQQVAEMVKTQAREAINRYELAERLVESVGFQSATDIRNLRTRVMELQQEKQLALMQFCDEILRVFAEFGHATPEKKYDSPSLVISDLRSIFQLHQIDAEQIAQLERVNETLRERLRFYEQSEAPF